MLSGTAALQSSMDSLWLALALKDATPTAAKDLTAMAAFNSLAALLARALERGNQLLLQYPGHSGIHLVRIDCHDVWLLEHPSAEVRSLYRRVGVGVDI